ncbi:hypothetical protein V1506DRAFT_534740 [Lipomyces tetrasporus]
MVLTTAVLLLFNLVRFYHTLTLFALAFQWFCNLVSLSLQVMHLLHLLIAANILVHYIGSSAPARN